MRVTQCFLPRQPLLRPAGCNTGRGAPLHQPSAAAAVDLPPTAAISDLDALAHACQQLHLRLGRSAARRTAPRLTEVLDEAVRVRGWPAGPASAALVAVAADPTTRGPMRLASPGPWWDKVRVAARLRDTREENELRELEARLYGADGQRVWPNNEPATTSPNEVPR